MLTCLTSQQSYAVSTTITHGLQMAKWRLREDTGNNRVTQKVKLGTNSDRWTPEPVFPHCVLLSGYFLNLERMTNQGAQEEMATMPNWNQRVDGRKREV